MLRPYQVIFRLEIGGIEILFQLQSYELFQDSAFIIHHAIEPIHEHFRTIHSPSSDDHFGHARHYDIRLDELLLAVG